jgi:hypothetical protein
VSIKENFISITMNNKKREKANSGNKYNKLSIIKLSTNKKVLNKL